MSAIKSVLLVDDDETTNFLNQFFIRQSLPALEVYVALNGREALSLLKELEPHRFPCMLLLDTQMPIMNGWEFLERYPLEIDEKTRDRTRIVLLTALESSEVSAQLNGKVSVHAIANKPLSDVILRRLVSICEGQGTLSTRS